MWSGFCWCSMCVLLERFCVCSDGNKSIGRWNYYRTTRGENKEGQTVHMCIAADNECKKSICYSPLKMERMLQWMRAIMANVSSSENRIHILLSVSVQPISTTWHNKSSDHQKSFLFFFCFLGLKSSQNVLTSSSAMNRSINVSMHSCRLLQPRPDEWVVATSERIN